MFRWYVLGWRPDIHDAEVVKKTVEGCARFGLESAVARVKDIHGHDMSLDEQQEYLEESRQAFRTVIDHYIVRFSCR